MTETTNIVISSQEDEVMLEQWIIDMIEGTQPDFWWVY